MQVIDTPWSAMQHAVKHYKSFSYNQAIQAAQLNPLAIRMAISPADVSKRASSILVLRFKDKLKANPGWNVVDLISSIYSRFAVFLSLVFARTRTPGFIRKVDEVALEVFDLFQALSDCFGLEGNKHKQTRKPKSRGKKRKVVRDEDDDSADEIEVEATLDKDDGDEEREEDGLYDDELDIAEE